MVAKPWFRVHADILQNKRVQECPDHLFKLWMNCNAILAQEGVGKSGLLPPVADCAYSLRKSVEDTVKLFDALCDVGLLTRKKETKDETKCNENETKSETFSSQSGSVNGTLFETFHFRYYVNLWGEKQYKSDSSTDRVREHRERKKALQETFHVTPPDQIRSDTDQIRSEADLSLQKVEGKGVKRERLYSGNYDIMRHLTDGEISEARQEAVGWDIYHLAGVFNKSISDGRMQEPKAPQVAFKAWVKVYTKGKPPT